MFCFSLTPNRIKTINLKGKAGSQSELMAFAAFVMFLLIFALTPTHIRAHSHSLQRLSALTPAPAPAHYCSLPHLLMHEYLWENDRSRIFYSPADTRACGMCGNGLAWVEVCVCVYTPGCGSACRFAGVRWHVRDCALKSTGHWKGLTLR